MEKKDFTKEQLQTLISEGVKKILNENSNIEELFSAFINRWDDYVAKSKLNLTKNWMSEKFSNYKFEIKKMRLPPNVAGFTTKEGVFFNQNFDAGSYFRLIFAIIHEFEHYKEYLTIPDELEYIKTEEDFETFFQNVIAVEKRVDNASELEMHELNLILGNPIEFGVNKQPFDLLDYVKKYKPFMKQVHNLWLKDREKYHSIDDLLKAISFGEIKMF